MKLLKFVNGDAPQTLSGVQLKKNTLTITNSSNRSANKGWELKNVDGKDGAASHVGNYWLLGDDNKPICLLNDIILAIPPTPSSSTTFRTNVGEPKGVLAKDVAEVSLKSKMGQRLERTRAEYGYTYKTAAKTARDMMDAEVIQNRRQEKMKRQRDEVVDAIEKGTALPGVKVEGETTKRTNKRSKK